MSTARNISESSDREYNRSNTDTDPAKAMGSPIGGAGNFNPSTPFLLSPPPSQKRVLQGDNLQAFERTVRSRGAGPMPRVQRTLAELERELLGDENEEEEEGSISYPLPTTTTTTTTAAAAAATATATAATTRPSEESNWGDILEGLIAPPGTPSILQVRNSLSMPPPLPVHQSLLIACASAIAEDNLDAARAFLARLAPTASFHGDPAQRLTAHLCQALSARIEQSATRPPPPPSSIIIASMQALYKASPYYKFGYMAANSAIIEAVKGENKVHIVDFDIGQGNQWIAMIRAFAARPGGPPQLRITGVAGPQLHAFKGGVKLIGRRLEELAKVSGIQFEFNAIETDAAEVEAAMIERRAGEALAANMAFQLHRVPDESVCMANPRDRLLRIVHALEPHVVTLVEYEANANTALFLPRFVETLTKYAAMFESLDTALPRDSERESIERHCLARSLLNIVACEGPERVERYERFGKWRARMNMAGFRLSPLSRLISTTINTLIQKYPGKYFLKEEGGALHLGWKDTVLVVASAWAV